MNQKMSKISKNITIISLIAKLSLFSFALIWANPVVAETSLIISNVRVNVTQEKVTISWNTNVAANGRVEYGDTLEYGRRVSALVPASTNHEINLFGLSPDIDYHFRIIAYTTNQEIYSFDQVFNTDDIDDLTLPKIKNISFPYNTGSTATIQWETSEPTSYVLRYGNTRSYGKKKSSSSRSIMHELTLTKLSPATTYHIQIEAKDKDGNSVVGQDLTFRTLLTESADKEIPVISNIKPVSSNDIGITNSSVIVSWNTNKLADGLVRYGTKATNLNKKQAVSGLRDFDHSVEIVGLKPDTQYYFTVESKDVFGKKVKSDVKSFITPSLPISAGRDVSVGVNKINKTAASGIYKVGNKLYAILNGNKHYIKNPEIFSRNGYDWSKVKTVSVETINNLPNIKLVKSPDDSSVYYLYNKGNDKFLKLAIPSAQIFSSYPQNSWGKVITIDKLDLDTFTSVKLIKAKNSNTVYLLENNIKKPFASAQAFLDGGHSWSDVVEINDLHLQSYDTGPAIN